jgi:hypothetical protein
MPAHSHNWVEISRGDRIGPGGGSNPYVIEQCSVCGDLRQRGL